MSADGAQNNELTQTVTYSVVFACNSIFHDSETINGIESNRLFYCDDILYLYEVVIYGLLS